MDQLKAESLNRITRRPPWPFQVFSHQRRSLTIERSMYIDWLDVDLSNLWKVGVAAGLGAVLGLERELVGKPAGIRTHMFVCAGSALLMILGQDIVDQFQKQDSQRVLSADPIRVLQAIVVGISFLGAGTIIHDREDGVEGLTTAATIFLTAGIGVAASVDRAALASVVTVGAVVALTVLGRLEKRLKR